MHFICRGSRIPFLRFLFTSCLLTGLLGVGSAQELPLRVVFESYQKDRATQKNLQEYKVKKIAENADFNYSKINNFCNNEIYDTINDAQIWINAVFEPIQGRFKYYQFQSTYLGMSKAEGKKEFHDILIIKTDSSNTVIDAFQYTLEWAEPPIEYDLFRSTTANIQLSNNLDIRKLGFQRTFTEGCEDLNLNDSGIISLPIDRK